MKKLISALALGGLLSTVLLAMSFEKPARPIPPTARANQAASPISISEVLRAHNVPQRPDALSTFSAEAVRLTSRPTGIDPQLASFFERQVSVAVSGYSYRRHTADRLRLREQFDSFDGAAPYHAVIENGRLIEAADSISDSDTGAEFSVKTFGLVPILKQLLDPSTEVVCVGRVYGRDKFDVKTSTDRWTIFTDQEHLICRLEARDRVIEYANYRSVDGIRLPFIQRLSVGGRLLQETVFSSITLNPGLPRGYFSREAISKEIAR